MKKIAIVVLGGILCLSAQAQEKLLPLTENYTIGANYKKLKLDHNKSAASVVLPFVDDFSKLGTVPDTAFWQDRNVFVNGDMAVNPPTVGVATFDGLDASGQAYDIDGSVGVADVLTSKPIDLDYLPSDSVYLSFFYQPQGLVAEPSASDLLKLEAKIESDSVWTPLWEVNGTSLKPFERVMVPIVDSNLLQDRFVFRFVSIGNKGGQFDTWHIDYVQLDEGRFISDTTLVDGAFTERHISLLNKYQEMPWSHFKANMSVYLAEDFTVYMRNLSSLQKNVGFSYEVFDDNVSIYSHQPAADNIDAFGDYEKSYPINFSFPTSVVEEKSFILKSYLSTVPDVNNT
ncbi:MAG: hypothetical protein ACI8ZO_001214, partial [Flavobacteriales bacterium]